MHRYREAVPRSIAGGWVNIHHNTLVDLGPAPGAKIRGVSRGLSEIHHNWFSTDDFHQAVVQTDPPGNLWVYDNVYGEAKTHAAVGPQTTPLIVLRQPPPPMGIPVEVNEDLELDLTVEAFSGRRITGVRITIDGKEIYGAADPPEPGQVVISRKDWPAGEHEFSVVATDDDGATATLSVDLNVCE